MTPTDWFPGVTLLGLFDAAPDWPGTGCWLLHHAGEAAVLELPPRGDGPCPAEVASAAAAARGLAVKYLLCTHAHADHFNRETLRRMRDHFPDATPVLHAGFVGPGVRIDHDEWLAVGGEPLALVPAPKHSLTDTLVVWRGTCCTGDWELGTLAGVHDGNPGAVPADRKRASLREMAGWEGRFDYRIRGVYSAHANDRREHLDFAALMRQTLAG